MKRRHLASTLVLSMLLLVGVATRAAAAPVVGKLTWLGQSCFVLETAAGTRVVMDPFGKGLGLELPTGLRADLVTVSHEHPDHNNVALVGGKPKVIRGLTADKKGWTHVDEKFRDLTVRSVGVYHDDKRGAERGLDTVFIFEVGGLRIAHLGDLGHALDDDQLEAIGFVDVLLVPVGGGTTIDARQATRVIDRLRPRLVVVPMHYKVEGMTVKDLDPLAPFLEGKANVQRETSRTITLSPVKPRPAADIVVLPAR